MEQTLSDNTMYSALIDKDPEFEGQFFAAVKTTGIFCRPTCSARKPKRENVEYFSSSLEALNHGYRPCKVCKPLRKKGEMPKEVQSLLSELENDPIERITDYGLRQRGLEPSRIRRWFLKNQGMTFHAYQRFLRINSAFQNIKDGDSVIEAAYKNGFDSLSGFQYSFKKATGISPSASKSQSTLAITRINTPLGPMFAIAADDGICLLEFTDRRMLETEFKQLTKAFKTNIIPGISPHFEKLKLELKEYFEGSRKSFSVPIISPGSGFQNSAWARLQEIPYGTTLSYKQQALAIESPNSIRAAARANGANRISIIIPCHRVIGDDGELKGYGGGLWRKKWLLEHELKNK